MLSRFSVLTFAIQVSHRTFNNQCLHGLDCISLLKQHNYLITANCQLIVELFVHSMSLFTINCNFLAKLLFSFIHILLKFRFRFWKAFGRVKAIVMEWIISDMIINNSLILLLQNKITIHNLTLFFYIQHYHRLVRMAVWVSDLLRV